MTLHVPGNREDGSFSKAWQNNFWQIVLTLQKNYDRLMANFVGTENDVVSKQVFLAKPREWFDVLVGATNGAITLTRKLGQRVISFVAEDADNILANQVFDEPFKQGDKLVAGSNITLTKKLGSITIDAAGSAVTTYFEPVTNGDPVTPELLFDGDGDVIMNEVPIP